MLRFTVLAVGSLKETYWTAACEEYIQRMTPFCRVGIIEVPESPSLRHASPAQREEAIRSEGERLLKKCPPDAVPIALCIEGVPMSSEQLAGTIERFAVGGKGHLAFLIGGSWGLSREVKASARLCLSMSSMTFPHQLARVMLCEQLYRVTQILSGGKYHK